MRQRLEERQGGRDMAARHEATAPPPEAAADRQQRRLDLAARAAWLYYIGEKTQDEIAASLTISRQGAQRLLVLARSAGLVRFRLDRRIAGCSAAAEQLRDRYGLRFCDVVPSSGVPITDVAVSAAEQMEARLAPLEPITLAVGSGRTLRAAVQQVFPVHRPQHRIVALVGNLTHAGRASPFEVASRLADITAAQCHPMPLPVVADTAAEAAQMRRQRVYLLLHDLVRGATTHFVGVGNIAHGAPLRSDGFVTAAEMDALLALGAVGEICGHPFDRDGRLVTGGHSARVMAIPFDDPPNPYRIGVSAGPAKVLPLLAALRGGWLSGLITDEVTAAGILDL